MRNWECRCNLWHWPHFILFLIFLFLFLFFFFFNLTFMGLLARAPLPLSATAGWSLSTSLTSLVKRVIKPQQHPRWQGIVQLASHQSFTYPDISRLYLSIIHWSLTLFVLIPIDYTYNLLQYDLQVQLRTICEFSCLYTLSHKVFYWLNLGQPELRHRKRADFRRSALPIIRSVPPRRRSSAASRFRDFQFRLFLWVSKCQLLGWCIPAIPSGRGKT